MALLNVREIEIVRLCAQGLTSKEIAKRLDLAPRTIEHYLEHARNKCGARNCAHLIAILYDEGTLGEITLLEDRVEVTL